MSVRLRRWVQTLFTVRREGFLLLSEFESTSIAGKRRFRFDFQLGSEIDGRRI